MLQTLKSSYQKLVKGSDLVELEQAVIRVVIGTLLIVFISGRSLYGDEVASLELLPKIVLGSFQFFAFLILFLVIHEKNVSVVRRVLSILLDATSITIFMCLTQEIGAFLIGLYLWITFGNGLRYGKNYLVFTQAASILGFITVFALNDYWKTNADLSYSILIMLVALPLYVGRLMHRIEISRQHAEEMGKIAEEASQAKTIFLANMSHEIRTPLNGIIGVAEILENTNPTTEQSNLLRILKNSSILLLSLLNNVLDFSKIESNKFEVSSSKFNINEILDESLGIFASQLSSKNLTLGLSCPFRSEVFISDPKLIKQVLVNLIGNAVKFTQQGGIRVSVSEQQRDGLRRLIRFEVVDTGVGIALEQQALIFEAFNQGTHGVANKFGGTGLGLSISKSMIEILGGKLSLESYQDQGSKFWFELWLDEVVDEASDLAINVDESQDAVQQLNILICEDDKTNQLVLERLLSLRGHRVSIVSDADELLDALESKSYDLVISDLNLGEINGIDALKIYRFMRPEDLKTRFVLFTADAGTPDLKDRALEAGFNGFLVKPIHPNTLFAEISCVMDRPNKTEQASPHFIPQETIAVTSSKPSPIDLSKLNELKKFSQNDSTFIKELFDQYLIDAELLVMQIQDLLKIRKFEQTRELCHALKGNSLAVGADSLANIASTIESIAPAKLLFRAEELSRKMQEELEAVKLAIKKILADI